MAQHEIESWRNDDVSHRFGKYVCYPDSKKKQEETKNEGSDEDYSDAEVEIGAD